MEIETYIETTTVASKKRYNMFQNEKFVTSNNLSCYIYRKSVSILSSSCQSNASQTHPMNAELRKNLVPQLERPVVYSLDKNVIRKTPEKTESICWSSSVLQQQIANIAEALIIDFISSTYNSTKPYGLMHDKSHSSRNVDCGLFAGDILIKCSPQPVNVPTKDKRFVRKQSRNYTCTPCFYRTYMRFF